MSEQSPAVLTAQTNAAFCACNTEDGFRVPEGMRLDVLMTDPREWRQAGLPFGGWATNSSYRLVPIVVEPERVPLGPEDVPATSEFLSGDTASRRAYHRISEEGVAMVGVGLVTWSNLAANDWRINRPRHRDADGRPTLWEPCSKPAGLATTHDEARYIAEPPVVDWLVGGYRLLVEGERVLPTDEEPDEAGNIGPIGIRGFGNYTARPSDEIRRKMPDVCPFAPRQVLETITDVEDAKWYQRHRGVYFQVLLHPEGRWTHLVDTEHAFSGPPHHYRRSP